MMAVHILLLGLFFGVVNSDYPFRNISLTWKERVDDLVSRLNLEEIMYQMAKGGGGDYGGPAPPITRLGIKPYQWDTECLSGDVMAGNATSFPISIGLAASFSPDLIFRVAEATSIEVRAKHNDYVKTSNYKDHTGLSCFSPVINIMRHPLWGRNQETYGEDPFLSGVYVANYVKGLQGNHPRYVRANAGCKHFNVHGGPENIAGSRFSFNSVVSDRDWRLTFLPAFRECVDAGSYSLMCSYNRINGVPACANSKLLTSILREEWNFTGYVVSDEGAIEFMISKHRYYDSPEDTVTGSVNAGCNLELVPGIQNINGIPACANSKLLTSILRGEWNFTGYVVSDGGAIEDILIHHFYYKSAIDTVAGSVNAGCNLELDGGWAKPIYLYMLDAIKKSLLLESTVRERVKPLFYTRMRLGEFDPPAMNPYSQLNLSVIQSQQHRKLAVEAAAKTFVLLKYSTPFLPFTSALPKIAILGPMANNSDQLFGQYAASEDPNFIVTPLDGLRMIAQKYSYSPGCNDGNKCSNYSSSDVKQAVQESDVIFVCLGTGKEFESEGHDRYNMDLPGQQLTLLQDTVSYAAKGVPIVLILFSGGPVNLTWAENNAAVQVIIQCFLPAQATGEALFTVLTSSGVYPAGRLPYTWYKDANQIPSMTNYSMSERTYRYFTGEPLYPFGFGLSYTTFKYSNLVIPTSIQAGSSIPVELTVANTGVIDSDEVVQVYISWLTTNETMPKLQLVGFDRLNIKKGSFAKVKVNIEPRYLAVWTDNKGFVMEPGSIKVYAGGQQPNQKKAAPSNILTAVVKISGFKIIK